MINAKNKSLIKIVAGVLVLGGVLFVLFGAVGAEKKIRLQKEKELSKTMAELTQTQMQFAELNKQKKDLEAQVKTVQASLEGLTKQYDEKIKAINGNVESLTKDNEELAKDKESSLKKIDELTKRIEGLETEKYDLITKIKALQSSGPVAAATPSVSGISTSQAAAEEDSVPLGNIVVQKSTGKPAQVDQVDSVYGFVIVSAGARDGLKKDSILNIARNRQLVAKAVVEKVQDNVSAAVILPEWSKSDVRVGDAVTVI